MMVPMQPMSSTKDAARVDMFFCRPIFRVRFISVYFNNQGTTIRCAVKALDLDPAGRQVMQEGLQDDGPAVCNI